MNSNIKLSNKPYIGTKDYIGENLDLLFYIFNKWRKLALSYNYAEYIIPLLEYADVYRAKSGEDLGNKELYNFKDKGGREVAIRPEATPSITRLVTKFYNTTPKPIKVFSILNFMRYERPQAGRFREFWQFNIDMFGDDSINSDFEMLKIATESILTFNPPKDSFVIYINNRPLMDKILAKISNQSNKQIVQRIIDKYSKLTPEEFKAELMSKAKLTNEQIEFLTNILQTNLKDLAKLIPELAEDTEYKRLITLFDMLKAIEYSQYIKFNPAIVRGIDYYNGIVFEAFDLNPNNNRAMFGGGRYNGLSEIFGINNMPAIGFAPGNATVEIFLQNWKLIPDTIAPTIKIFLPQIEPKQTVDYYAFADKVRNKIKELLNTSKTIAIEISLKQLNLNKALKYALAKNFDYLLIFGNQEKKNKEFILKNLKTREQKRVEWN